MVQCYVCLLSACIVAKQYVLFDKTEEANRVARPLPFGWSPKWGW